MTGDEINDTLTKLGTLTHNRTMSRKEWREYGGTDSGFKWLKSRGFIASANGSWHITEKGYSAVYENASQFAPEELSGVYYTVIVPFSKHPTKWHPTEETGPFSVLTRGAFDDELSARKWVEEHLEGQPFTIRAYPRVLE